MGEGGGNLEDTSPYSGWYSALSLPSPPPLQFPLRPGLPNICADTPALPQCAAACGNGAGGPGVFSYFTDMLISPQ